MSTPPALVSDRYRLVRLLGAGGMGVVWEAWDEKLHRTVALKMLRAQPELTDAERQTATDRAMREARITAGLHHPHAVTVFDVVEHEGQPCIVMQLVESTPLSVLLREHGTFSPSETARIGAQVASALAAAHALKIVHRDVKPGNILIGADGSALISDFGISHALGDTTITTTGLVHGTPAYLSPEAARGLPMSFASDVFSLGSTLYAMTEGKPPFGSESNPIALLHRVARGGYPAPKNAGPLTPLLRRMLATQAKRRPTMASVVDALSGLQQGPLEVPRAVLASTPPVPEDWTTQRLEPAQADDPDAAGHREPPAGDDAEPTTGTDAAAEPPTRETIASSEPPLTAVMPAEPTAETLRVDQPTRYEPPTAETEPLSRSVAAAPTDTTATTVPSRPAPTAPADEAPASPRTRVRRLWVVAGALILLVALAAGAWMLADMLRPEALGEGPTASSAAPTPPSTPAQATPTEEPSTTTAPPVEDETPAPQPALPEQRVVETIVAYYALMPGQRDSAWPLMTADYQQNHAGGRGGYEAFWSEVEAVSAAEVSATGADRGQATLTYTFRDGRTVQEVTSYRFVDEGGVLKIAETDVLSSAGQ
ncbi:serine/threonine-protein kinase [Microbacterium sp. BK668]|uniref:serine/threonine-protein kinase n=1 Tax=Microbacterium sp. BK668 TaxID=2512118 RepID=UPI0010D6BDCD|nr:serine/threonine-protein kinase [Microbacterium sp. BK668]TDN92061.1 serine/threonine protein kinase [Microbacterium sp. BK668]